MSTAEQEGRGVKERGGGGSALCLHVCCLFCRFARIAIAINMRLADNHPAHSYLPPPCTYPPTLSGREGNGAMPINISSKHS